MGMKATLPCSWGLRCGHRDMHGTKAVRCRRKAVAGTNPLRCRVHTMPTCERCGRRRPDATLRGEQLEGRRLCDGCTDALAEHLLNR